MRELPPTTAPSFPFRELVNLVLAEQRADGWGVSLDGFWCRVVPPVKHDRVQGWKLHLSATPLAAAEVLFRAAHILVRHGCQFKFAATATNVLDLNSGRYDRAQCGKFITVYPRDDDQFRVLAEELDQATAELPGPAIQSDRPYRKGGIVFYRYGAFGGVRHLTNDSKWQVRLQAPDGTLVEDVRKPWFCPPEWAPLPFAGQPGWGQKAAAKPVLLRDRYIVREALQHSARGGVYRATDQRSNTDVIIKQARAHVGERYTGEDARALLRREAEVMRDLAGLCPDVIEVFDHEGHTFLVESFIPGVSLTRWVHSKGADQTGGSATAGPASVAIMVHKLIDLLEAVHARGLVVRDFSPNNVMVMPDGDLRLIDPEFVTTPGTWMYRSYTPGFAAPEYERSPFFAPAPDQGTDIYALGAMVFYVVTAMNTALVADDDPGRSTVERLDLVLTLLGGDNEAATSLRPMILGLCAEDATDRWSLQDARAFLATIEAPEPVRPDLRPSWTHPSLAQVADPSGEPQRRMIADGLAHIMATMAEPGESARLWASGSFGATTDASNVQHGAAGVLATLVRAAETFDLGRMSMRLRDTIARVSGWLDARLRNVPTVLPGLYFGRAGTAWTLLDAARYLGDDALAQRATDFALELPVRWGNPDLFHGSAGAGMTQLRMWQLTGRSEFLDRAIECAVGVLAAAESTSDGLVWPVPADFDSGLAGIRHLGYAHGVAGIGTFLLAVAQVSGRRDLRDGAIAAGNTLATTVERGSWGARWRGDQKSELGSGMLYNLCSGSSGVGTFLIRLWAETADPLTRDLAEAAATAVYQRRWTVGTAHCHGLAGNGEFLLDMADILGDAYRRWAGELAAALYAKHAILDGRVVIPDETGAKVFVDYGVGISGVVGFLLRLRYGGARMFVADGAAAAGLVDWCAPNTTAVMTGAQ